MNLYKITYEDNTSEETCQMCIYDMQYYYLSEGLTPPKVKKTEVIGDLRTMSCPQCSYDEE